MPTKPYEHLIVRRSDPDELKALLDALSIQGWELVGPVQYSAGGFTATLKKQV